MAKKEERKAPRQKWLPKIIRGAGQLEAVIEGIAAGYDDSTTPPTVDIEAGGKAFIDALVSNYAGIKPIASADQGSAVIEPLRMIVGYGPPAILKAVNKFGVRIPWLF